MHGPLNYTTGSADTNLESYRRFRGSPMGKRPIKVSMQSMGNMGDILVCTRFLNTEAETDGLVRRHVEILARAR